MNAGLTVDRNLKRELRRNIVAGAIGVFVHWFDWAIYAYLATTIAVVFFPGQDSTAGLMSVFAVFAVAFFVRPLGSLVFGYLGDRIGRKKTLSMVIISMAAGTLMLGLIPSYQTIGLAAPILLIVARIIQGLAAGGEYGSAATFLAEFSPAKKRGLGTSWIEVGSVLGFLLASLVVAGLHVMFTPEQVVDWAWRLPFLLTVPLAAIGLYIRLKIEDTPDYKAVQEAGNVSEKPIREVFQSNFKQFVQTVGVEIFMNCTFYVVLVYLITYQEDLLGFSGGEAAVLSAVASLTAALLIPVSGLLSDKFGRKAILATAGVLLLVGSYPLFLLMNVGSPTAGFLATFGLASVMALILGTHTAAVSELFPTRTRQSGLSLAYAVAGAFFAGMLPYLNTWLISVTNNNMVPAMTLIVVAMVGLITVWSMPETKGIALLHDTDLKNNKASVAKEPATP